MDITKRELEILYKANYEAYRNTKRKMEWAKRNIAGEEEYYLVELYENELEKYMDIKLKLDKEFEYRGLDETI